MVTKQEAAEELKRRGVLQQQPNQQGRSYLDPIMPAVEGFNLGIESRLRGIGQAGADVLGALGANTEEFSQGLAAKQELEERKYKKRFGDTTSGSVGRFLGDLGPLAPLGPLLPAAPVIGGLAAGGIEASTAVDKELGGLAPRLQTGAVGAAFGAAGGKGMQYLGKALKMGGAKFSDMFTDIMDAGIDETQAFRRVRNLLGKEAEVLSKQVSKNYEKAKEVGKNTFVQKKKIYDLIERAREMKKTDVTADGRSAINNIVNDLRALTNQTEVSVNDLEAIRSAASKASSRVYSAGALARDIDDFLIDNAPTTKAGALYKKAIQSRREFAQKFEDPAEIAFSIDAREPLEAVEAKFFNRGTFNPRAAKIYDDVIKALPASKKIDAEKYMKQSIVNKMIKDAAGKVDEADAVSGVFLANRIGGLRKNNPDLWSKFDETEKKLLSSLEDQIRKESKGGFINKTANFLTRFLTRATGSNIELPRTIKPKSVYTLDDLMELTKIVPHSSPITPVAGATTSTLGTLAVDPKRN